MRVCRVLSHVVCGRCTYADGNALQYYCNSKTTRGLLVYSLLYSGFERLNVWSVPRKRARNSNFETCCAARHNRLHLCTFHSLSLSLSVTPTPTHHGPARDNPQRLRQNPPPATPQEKEREPGVWVACERTGLGGWFGLRSRAICNNCCIETGSSST